MTDDFGVPDNFFGSAPERFYGLVGRVVLLSSLVEQCVLALTWTLDRAKTQDEHAGKSGKALLDICRLKVNSLPELKADGGPLLDRTEAALGERHGIVHSLWPNPGRNGAYGWRPVRGQRRSTPRELDR
jgi:hypothetical protein